MRIEVLFFAAARERAGRDRHALELADGATVQALLDALVARHAALGPLVPHLRVAVNQEFAPPETVLRADDEVALIPPVAGGSDAVVALTAAPLSLDAVVRAVSGPGFGGVVTFTGAVRDHSRGKRVVRLEYEAYGDMAVKVLERIVRDGAARFGARLAIHHRTGTLQVGELAVVIAAAAAHRAEAFDACRFAIEELKRDVPIWKKELADDGESWVGLGP